MNPEINIKYRQTWQLEYSRTYSDIIYYGFFYGWGIKNNTTAAIVKPIYFKKTVGLSRDINAKEEDAEIFIPNPSLQLISLNYSKIYFI